VLDGAGALAALLVARVGWQRVADMTTAVLLWGALGGGAVLLVLDATVGLSSPALWITTPAAALVLALRRRARSRPRP
jgi:hypothetical protein